MAAIRQFNKGEDIKITVKVNPDSEDDFGNNASMYIYLDSLDLASESTNSNKIIAIKRPIETPTDSGVWLFSIPSEKTKQMDAGDYTIELKYGSTGDISIVKQNHAFTLVESGYNKKS